MGKQVNPKDLVRIERLNKRLPLRIFDEKYKEKFNWATIDGGTIKIDEDQLRKELLPLVKVQEPDANELRRQELVSRIVDRAMNYRVVYLNKSTGEVTT